MTELLIAIAILVLITGLTISAFNVSFENERLGSGARRLQSMLEGARDRAIYAKQPRGIRLLLNSVSSEDINGNGVLDTGEDTNGNGFLDVDATTVSTMSYIGLVDDWTQGSFRIYSPAAATLLVGVHEDLNNNGILDYGASGNVGSGEDRNASGSLDVGPATGWYNLQQQGLLKDGSKIRILGNWYTVDTSHLSRFNEDDDNDLTLDNGEDSDGNGRLGLGEALIITPPLKNLIDPTEGSLTIRDGEYRLLLVPRFLENEDPVTLPEGIVIDLDNSLLPANWTSGGYFSNEMDILFSPNGTVIGPASVNGLIHFMMNDSRDTDRDRGLDGAPGQLGVDDDGLNGVDDPREQGYPGSDDLLPIDIDRNANGQLDDNEINQGDKLIVTLFTRTGMIKISRLFITEDLNGNGAVDLVGGVTGTGEDVIGNGILDVTLGVNDPTGRQVFYYAESRESLE